MELARKAVEAAVEQVHDHGLELELRESYSGRSMYGTQTWGVVGDAGALALFTVALTIELVQDDEYWDELGAMSELIDSLRVDSMAMDMIHYFPHVELV